MGGVSYLYMPVSELSGGQSQRVNIARACVGTHSILIADEPTASLDINLAHKVMERVMKSAPTVIFTTHDASMLSYADRIITIDKGTILQESMGKGLWKDM